LIKMFPYCSGGGRGGNVQGLKAKAGPAVVLMHSTSRPRSKAPLNIDRKRFNRHFEYDIADHPCGKNYFAIAGAAIEPHLFVGNLLLPHNIMVTALQSPSAYNASAHAAHRGSSKNIVR